MPAQNVSFPSNIIVTLFWTDFKSIFQSKDLLMQYVTGTFSYTIFCLDGQIAYVCTIWTGTVPDDVIAAGYSQAQNDTDKSDFTTNFKSTSNGRISRTYDFGNPITTEFNFAAALGLLPGLTINRPTGYVTTASTGGVIIK